MVVDLGCGRYKLKGAIGIDRRQDSAADIIADIDCDGIPLKDNSVDVVRSSHFMEHLRNVDFVLREIYRVLKKPGGRLEFLVPWAQSQAMFATIDHQFYIGDWWLQRDLTWRQYFTDVRCEYEYNAALLAEVRRAMPDLSLPAARALFWNIVRSLRVTAVPRVPPLTREEAIEELLEIDRARDDEERYIEEEEIL